MWKLCANLSCRLHQMLAIFCSHLADLHVSRRLILVGLSSAQVLCHMAYSLFFSMLVVWTWHLKLNARSLYSFEVLVCVNVQSLDFLLKPLCRSDFCCHPVVVWIDTEAISHVHWYDTSSIELKPTWIATISHKNFPQSQQFIASVLICSAHLLCRCWYCWH